MKKDRKVVLITGSTGFIGGNLLNKIPKDKYNILAPDRDELDLLDSTSVLNFFSKNKIDVVLHCAASGVNRNNNKKNILKNNLLMFFNIVEAQKLFGRLINFGSGAEYDKTREIKQISEEEFRRRIPKDDYGLSKFVCAKYAMEVDFITHIRLFGVFGENEDYRTRFISNAICQAISGKEININQNVYFDFLFVDDLVEIIEKVIDNIDSLKHSVYNVGVGKSLDLITIAKKINTNLGKEKLIKVNKEGLNNEYTCSVERAKKEFLKDFQYTDIDKAVDKLITFYNSNLNTWNKDFIV